MARRNLISKGNDLTLNDAVDIALNFQATLSNTSSFENMSVNAVRRGKSQHQQRKGCKYCGTSHPPKKCPAYGKKCHKCGNTNHFGNICLDFRGRSQSWQQSKSRGKTSDRSKENYGKPKVHANQVVEEGEEIHFDDTTLNCGSIEFSEANVAAITNSKGERQVIMAKLDVKPPNISRKVTLRVKADTGSNGNILPTRCLRQMYPNADRKFSGILKPTLATLIAINDTNIHTYGTIEMPSILDKSAPIKLLLFVCDTSGPAILSCDASERL